MIRNRLVALLFASAVATGGIDAGAASAAKPVHVVIGKPEARPGDNCRKGTEGCSKSGKFTGNFFG